MDVSALVSRPIWTRRSAEVRVTPGIAINRRVR